MTPRRPLPPLWLKQPSRYAGLSPAAARAVLAVLGLLIALSFTALLTPDPTGGAPAPEEGGDLQLYAGIVDALVYLAFQIKDEVIPLLHEATSTARVVRSTTEFMSEEAVKPVIDAVGAYARLRGMMNAVKPKKR